jgi:hypothetical protein
MVPKRDDAFSPFPPPEDYLVFGSERENERGVVGIHIFHSQQFPPPADGQQQQPAPQQPPPAASQNQQSPASAQGEGEPDPSCQEPEVLSNRPRLVESPGGSSISV